MAYFNYHAKIKKLINEGKLKGFQFVENFNGIKPALVLFFENERPMPIREHRFNEYVKLLKELNAKEIKG